MQNLLTTKRTESVYIRLSPIERKALESLAIRHGLKISETLRHYIRVAAEHEQVWPMLESTNERAT